MNVRPNVREQMTPEGPREAGRGLSGLTAAVLALVVATCASGPRGGEALRCDGCSFAATLGEVVAALADIDAQVVEARVSEGAGTGELWGLIDWRRPAADSAILIIGLSSDPAGTTVSYAAVPLARALETRATATPVANAPGPPAEVCQPCRAWQVAIEASPGDNLRALAQQREASRCYGEALAQRFATRGAQSPPPPGLAGSAGRPR
jgi:hypothetical protein